MFKVIKDSAKKAWKGEERLWKVFWLWGVLLYPTSFLIGAFLVKPTISLSQVSPFITFVIALFMGICGATMIIIYPVIFIASIFRCIKNRSGHNKSIGNAAIIAILLIFIPLHLCYSWIVGLATAGYLVASFAAVKIFLGV